MMARAGAGLFRVMAEPDPERTEALRAAAVALGFSVPPLEGLRALAATRGPVPALTAFRRAARRAGGAGYRVLGPDDPAPWHAAVAAPYAHATAPLRRLADRYVLDLLVALAARGAPGDEDRATLEALVPVMGRAEAVADRVEAAAIDLVEATLLHRREGEVFDAVVLGVDGARARVQLREPPVRGSVPDPAGLVPGDEVPVRLVRADPGARTVALRRADAGAAGGNGSG
jgi:exoribonuclease R